MANDTRPLWFIVFAVLSLVIAVIVFLVARGLKATMFVASGSASATFMVMIPLCFQIYEFLTA